MLRADLSGKVAFVVGSTRGIGKSTALLFAANGADVVLNGRNPEPAKEILDKIRGMGRRAIFEQANINHWPEVQRMVNDAIEKMGKIDIMAIVGGTVPGVDSSGKRTGPASDFFHEFPPEDYVNFAVMFWINRLYCIRAVLDHMIERNFGKIVMVGTDAGRWPTPGEPMACGAGAAINMMTRVLAAEFTRWNIRVNMVCTTVTRDTPGLDYVLNAGPASAARIFKKALDKQPFPVVSQDIAEACLFLGSDESNQITGQILSVNGGLSFP